MLTLKEFITEIGKYEHYRIYQPNRDCLIFESYFKVHSPYKFNYSRRRNKKMFQDDYWDNNKFDDTARAKGPVGMDAETRHFLKKFGNYKVFRIETSGFKPHDMWKGEDGELHFHYYDEDPLRPYQDYIDCFDLFIIPR